MSLFLGKAYSALCKKKKDLIQNYINVPKVTRYKKYKTPPHIHLSRSAAATDLQSLQASASKYLNNSKDSCY